MIASLRGVLTGVQADCAIVEVGGIGFRVSTPQSTLDALPSVGQEVSLHIFTHVREDALLLYGFSTVAEKETFQLLLGVAGVGPRLALAVLSGMSPAELARVVMTRDTKELTRIPGIGKKTAERLFLELGDKLPNDALARISVSTGAAGGSASSRATMDAVEALVSLGYARSEAEHAVSQVIARQEADEDATTLVRLALRSLVTHM